MSPIVLTSVLGFAIGADDPLTTALPRETKVRISYRIVLPSNPKDEVARLWIPLPAENEHQSVEALEVNAKHTTTRDETTGNRFAYFEFRPASKMPESITLKAVVKRKARSIDDVHQHAPPSAILEAALKPQTLLPIDGEAKQLSNRIVGATSSDFEKARRIYDFVLTHMNYDKQEPGWGNADFDRACRVGKGNCTDFHGLFLALCRAQKIPARFEIGVELAIDGSNRIPGGYHCWAEFFDSKRGWIPVDISTAWKRASEADNAGQPDRAAAERCAGFGFHDAYRIAFSQGLDVETAPAASGPVRYVIDPVLEIDGKRISSGDPAKGGWSRTWSYDFVNR